MYNNILVFLFPFIRSSLHPLSVICLVFLIHLFVSLFYFFLLRCLLSVPPSLFILTAIHPFLLPHFYMYVHKYIIVILPFVSFFLPF
jgi:hypothetical protein